MRSVGPAGSGVIFTCASSAGSHLSPLLWRMDSAATVSVTAFLSIISVSQLLPLRYSYYFNRIIGNVNRKSTEILLFFTPSLSPFIWYPVNPYPVSSVSHEIVHIISYSIVELVVRKSSVAIVVIAGIIFVIRIVFHSAAASRTALRRVGG